MSDLPQEYYLQQEEVFNDFLNQLIKDAEMSGIILKKEALCYHNIQEVILNLSEQIQAILHTVTTEKLQSWLYRVDISEKYIKEQTSVYPYKTYNILLAETIVKRTLQKVVLRYLHKNNLL